MNIVFLDAGGLRTADLGPVASLGNFESYDQTSADQLTSRVAKAEVIITNKVRIDASVLAVAPKLSLVVASATGTDHIDSEACRAAGVAVANVSDYATESVAQYTLTAALTLRMRLRERDAYCKSGDYARSQRWTQPVPQWSELGGRWGIIGLGAIGHRVGELARSFGCETVFFSPSGTREEADFEQVDLSTLLSTCATISIHAPGAPRYRNLIGEQQLNLLRPEAVLVVAGRGGTVDEDAVAEHLDAGEFAGAAFDVFADEPFATDHPFTSLKHPERLLLSPHMAWTSDQALRLLVAGIAARISSHTAEP